MIHGWATAALAIGIVLSPPLHEAARAERLQIGVAGLAFHDVPAAAHVGDVVEWSNRDFVDHTATARDGSFDVRLPHGKTGQTVLKHAGKIAFYCRFHPNMTGEITVSP